MLIAGFPAGVFGTNCYLVAPGPGEECVIIDPGQGAWGGGSGGAGLDALIAEHRLRPVAVLATHGHLDHIWSVAPVCSRHGGVSPGGIPAWIHPADRALLSDPGLGFPPGDRDGGLRQLTAGVSFTEPDDVRELSDGQPLTLAGLEFTVRHAPGHTPGSVTFELPGELQLPAALGDNSKRRGALFSGDLLFAGSVGRSDLPGGDPAALADSLTRICLPGHPAALPDDTAVLPGHGPATTIGTERRTNPFLVNLPAPSTPAPSYPGPSHPAPSHPAPSRANEGNEIR